MSLERILEILNKHGYTVEKIEGQNEGDKVFFGAYFFIASMTEKAGYRYKSGASIMIGVAEYHLTNLIEEYQRYLMPNSNDYVEKHGKEQVVCSDSYS